MAIKTHNLAIKTGTYQTREGETKGRYLNIGSVFTHDDGGMSIKLDCVPVGLKDWEGWVNAFPAKDRQQNPADEYRKQSAGAQVDPFRDDDIPDFG